MYLYGASGHAKGVIDILRANKIEVEGLFDDNETLVELMGYPVRPSSEVSGPLIITVGKNSVRRQLASRLPVPFGTAVDPSVILSPEARLEEGTVVMQGAIVQSSVRIGRHCIVGVGASISHDCVVGDYVHVSPHVTLCGNVHVGEGTMIGAGSTVIPGVKIGRWSVIGAGSVVTKDIPDGVLAVGNRCKIIKKIMER
jgi:sugar O-acyltransferase (sialic acid O-acetyltransferase NeuD family)